MEKATVHDIEFPESSTSSIYMSSVYDDKPGTLVQPTLEFSGKPIPFKPDSNERFPAYWAVVLSRSLPQRIVFNRAFVFSRRYKSTADYFSEIHSQLEPFTDKRNVLYLTTTLVNVLAIPQGPLYSLLRSCGGGKQLEQLEEWTLKQDSTNHGRVAYCLVGVMGRGADSGREAMASSGASDTKPLTCELSISLRLESENGQVVWTPQSS